MRNLTRSLSTIRSPTVNGERGSIIKAQWSPFTSTIFATCGYGRKVDVWDLTKDNSQGQNQETNYLFRHGGHRSKVMDMDWNKNEKLLIGSVEESNCLHVWQMAKSIYYDEEWLFLFYLFYFSYISFLFILQWVCLNIHNFFWFYKSINDPKCQNNKSTRKETLLPPPSPLL